MSGNDVIPFRSHLERAIADELDSHDVEWGYEVPQAYPDGTPIRYLPDFQIFRAPTALELPSFIEGKPQEFIYNLRDDLGVTRRYGDRFARPIVVRDCDAERLKVMQIPELWKPKMLAEITGVQVLVVGGVGGMSRLSVTMGRSEIVFRRDHPFVNWRAVVRDRQRQERQRAYEEQQSRYADERRRQASAAAQQRAHFLAAVRELPHFGRPRFAGRCDGCQEAVDATHGHLHLHEPIGQRRRWFTLCDRCERQP